MDVYYQNFGKQNQSLIDLTLSLSFIINYLQGFTLSVNHLADKTDLELKALRGRRYSGVYNGGSPFPYKHIDRAQLPSDFDWRLYGAVTPVKGAYLGNVCAL